MELKVDPRFRDKIPPLTAAEFTQLEANIVADGEVREPLVVWNGTIIDGHHRWQIIQKHPEIPYKVKEMSFPDEWAAIVWMCQNQLGKRNLTEAQKAYLIGKQYEAQKMALGGDRKSKDQNEPLISKGFENTAQKVAADVGVAEPTVKRAAQFVKGLDAAEAVSPGIKDAVLTGELKTTKAAVAAVAKLPEAERTAAVEQIKHPSETRKVLAEIRESISTVKANDESNTETRTYAEIIITGMSRDVVDTAREVKNYRKSHSEEATPETAKKIAALSEAEAAIAEMKGWFK